MPITLAVIAGLALLLPGLTAIALSSLRGRRNAASRPELQLTAVSVIVVAVGGSLLVHLITYGFVYGGLWSAQILGHALPSPGHLNQVIAAIFYDHGHLRPALPNPFDLIVKIAGGGSISPAALAEIVIVLVFETGLAVSFVADEGVDLFLDGVDVNNQGWVFEHITRPGQNGYRPIAYVLTTIQKDGLGIGYKGVVGDIRQSDKGETLAISLNEPERFLYELRPSTPLDSGQRGPPTFDRYPDEYIGGVVALDAKVILNIVVSNPRADLVSKLGVAADDYQAPARPLAEIEAS